MKNISFILAVLLFVVSCNKKNVMTNPKQSFSKSDTVAEIIDTASAFNKDKVKEYQTRVINNGDVLSFSKLIIHYEDKSDYKELHKYTLIMADKYNNGSGYNQAFVNIVAMNNNNKYMDVVEDFGKINQDAKGEALSYLKKGVSLNDINSMSMLADIYRNGIGIEKDIKKADELKEKIEKL